MMTTHGVTVRRSQNYFKDQFDPEKLLKQFFVLHCYEIITVYLKMLTQYHTGTLCDVAALVEPFTVCCYLSVTIILCSLKTC